MENDAESFSEMKCMLYELSIHIHALWENANMHFNTPPQLQSSMRCTEIPLSNFDRCASNAGRASGLVKMSATC